MCDILNGSGGLGVHANIHMKLQPVARNPTRVLISLCTYSRSSSPIVQLESLLHRRNGTKDRQPVGKHQEGDKQCVGTCWLIPSETQRANMLISDAIGYRKEKNRSTEGDVRDYQTQTDD